MRALFDVSMLLAMFDPAHMHFPRARVWWRDHRDAGWASCPLSQNGFVRIMSQPSYPRPVTPAEASFALHEQMNQPGHAFWPDDISITDPSLFDHSRILGPSQITDVYLLALALKHGGRLVTFDKGVPVAAVKGATKAHVVSL